EDYFTAVVLSHLTHILNDSSLSSHHSAAMQAVVHVFTSLGIHCAEYVPTIIPPLLNLIKSCDKSVRNSVLQQLSSLITVVKRNIFKYVESIFQILQEFWIKGENKLMIVVAEEALYTAL